MILPPPEPSTRKTGNKQHSQNKYFEEDGCISYPPLYSNYEEQIIL